jgi:hypothetical protein
MIPMADNLNHSNQRTISEIVNTTLHKAQSAEYITDERLSNFYPSLDLWSTCDYQEPQTSVETWVEDNDTSSDGELGDWGVLSHAKLIEKLKSEVKNPKGKWQVERGDGFKHYLQQ